jgi:hypothetical protein
MSPAFGNTPPLNDSSFLQGNSYVNLGSRFFAIAKAKKNPSFNVVLPKAGEVLNF